MAMIDIEFDWPRAFEYELGTAKGEKVIRQVGTRTETILPLRNGRLYLDFAGLNGSPEACLEFAKSWGFLGFDYSVRGLPTPSQKGAEERIADWRLAIKFINEWLRVLRGDYGSRLAPGWRTRTEIATVKVLLTEEGQAQRALVLRPPSLFDAMKLQLAQASGSGNDIKACPQCGRWFEAGARGKRTVARFCSDKCRNQHHRRTHQ